MLNVITINTVRNITRDGYEAVVTTHTVGGYTLFRTYFPDLEHTSWKVGSPNDLPSITDMSNLDAETPEFGVNWAAFDTQPTTNARAYGALVMTAADVADVFNRIVANG